LEILSKKNSNKISTTPAHFILAPTDNSRILNFTNLNDIGANTLKASNTFKKIQIFSKISPQKLFLNLSEFNTRYTRIFSLYLNENHLLNAPSYGTLRQVQFTSKAMNNTQRETYLDSVSITKLLNYTNIFNPPLSDKISYKVTVNLLQTNTIFLLTYKKYALSFFKLLTIYDVVKVPFEGNEKNQKTPLKSLIYNKLPFKSINSLQWSPVNFSNRGGSKLLT